VTDSPRSPKPSAALLSAALGALLLAAPACDGTSASQTPQQPFECESGVSPTPEVTSSTVQAMTQAQFASECEARSGVFEIEPHCGGLNHCRGLSYDTATQVLTEHTCRATNTCAGFSCIVCN
jgi:hypothetical protein